MDGLTERQGIVWRMKRIEDYFQRSCVNSELFQPEHECAKEINVIVGRSSPLTTEDANELMTTYNRTNAGDHYNGSGWFDFQLQLRHLLKVNGFTVVVEACTGHMKIVADKTTP